MGVKCSFMYFKDAVFSSYTLSENKSKSINSVFPRIDSLISNFIHLLIDKHDFINET